MVVTSTLKVKQIKMKSLNWLVFSEKPELEFFSIWSKKIFNSYYKRQGHGIFDNVLPWSILEY